MNVRKVFVLVSFFTQVTAQASLGQVASRRPPEPGPQDVTLRVRTHGGQSTFRIGETIDLDLVFTSRAPGYQVNISRFDRTDDFKLDRVEVEPDGWDDPLGLFFRLCPTMFEGGLENTKLLSARPVIVGLELNEWIRFAAPGEYQVTVQSERLTKIDAGGGKRPVSIRSNRLSLRIASATEQWQQQTLKRAVAVLDGPKSAGDDSRVRQGARRLAARTLRYLGTAAAMREMAHRFGSDDYTYECLLGLVGSPARRAALDQMSKLLADDPYFPVDGQFLCAISVVALPQDSTEGLAPQHKALEIRFRDELRAALKNKRGRALAVSKETVGSVQ
jgi:hypothetical protein